MRDPDQGPRPSRNRGALFAALLVVVTLLGAFGYALVDRVRNPDLPQAAEAATSSVAGDFMSPFYCTTALLGLAEPEGPDCEIDTQVSFYVLTSEGVRELVDPAALPEATTTINLPSGRNVPAVIRVETGVINRSIYRFATLEPDPARAAQRPSDDGVDAWNGRLAYFHGGGCGVGYGQGIFVGTPSEVDWLSDLALGPLRLGHAAVSTTHNIGANSCNDVLSAATTAQMIDHVAVSLGDPDFVIGIGGSGGAMLMLLTVQNYPGLLDGVIATAAFPDAVTVLNGAVGDCRLLTRFFASPEGRDFTPEQRAAIGGHASETTCERWDTFGGIADSALVDSECVFWVPENRSFDPLDNPDGLRCSYYESNANTLLTDDSGRALRLLDNVGVQYGLEALNDGVINVNEFLVLNEFIGGFDASGRVVSTRSDADDAAVANAYSSGRVFTGARTATVPVFLVSDDLDRVGDPHTVAWARSIRERIESSNDGESNAVVWTRLPGAAPTLSGRALVALDDWLVALREADFGDSPTPAQVASVRPDEATDLCVTGSRIIDQDEATYEPAGLCAERSPASSEPRTVAGGPVTNDVLQCSLSPVSDSAYDVEFAPDQFDRLGEVFPAGVCDWSAGHPGSGVVADPWQRFG